MKSTIDSLLARPQSTGTLLGSSVAWLLAHWSRTLPGPAVVMVDSAERADTLAQDLQLFCHINRQSCGIMVWPARQTSVSPTFIEDEYVIHSRLRVLHAVLQGRPIWIVASVSALCQWTVPKQQFLKATGLVIKNSEFDRDLLVQELVQAGYEREATVESPGTFAVRGAIVDFYSPDQSQPWRVEFDGDQVLDIRVFSSATQQSEFSADEASWIPAREILWQADDSQPIRHRLKALCNERGLPPGARLAIEDGLSQGRRLAAYHALFPLFYDQPALLEDYLPSTTSWFQLDPMALQRAGKELEQVLSHSDQKLVAEQCVAVLASRHFTKSEQLLRAWQDRPSMVLSEAALQSGQIDLAITTHFDLRQELILQRKKDEPLAPLLQALDHWRNQGFRVYFVAYGQGEAQRMQQLLRPYVTLRTDLANFAHQPLQEGECALIEGELSEGFVLAAVGEVFITSHELFGDRKKQRYHDIAPPEAELTSLEDLTPGQAIVHIDHGIGLFQGLQKITVNHQEGDFLLIEYAGGDKLFLPVYRLNRIHKYLGADGKKPSLDRLGQQSTWAKTKEKAKRAVEEMAQDLIELYAKRKVATTEAFPIIDPHYLAFESDFPFEETRDQLRTLAEVSQDLESGRPADRLICGDVGFGKTEIALRAAFRTATQGKQTAVLVPTTILCQQHFETFRKRLKDYPVRVDFLSRFKSATEQRQVVTALKEGALDIVVGTHRLLSKDVQFAKLGLLVLDEEHRFGVKHKEVIKKYRNQVHVLTLTATPIPRTLQLSLTGIRDLSVINTPPVDRQAVQTFLCQFEDGLIRDAIQKELQRGGQVFFLHNRVDTIEAMRSYLARLVPTAKIVVAHGQMTEKSLEQTMLSFMAKEFDVLLCTTIIESGLDIPAANTILINRADCLGLAQLYQIRGRVGRSHRSAYCYLLIPGEEVIGRDALKRLRALQRFTQLGSGMRIALHDLEIRGAGNLLGQAQSGHIANIGFELYTQLLEREVRSLKGEEVEDDFEPEIQTMLPAFLPESYVADSHERLVLYKRLSAAQDHEQLQHLQTELSDRFGPLPQPVLNLLEVIDLKIWARRTGVAVLRLSVDQPVLEFIDSAPINIDKLLALVKKNKRLHLRPDHKLTIQLEANQDAMAETKTLLMAIAQPKMQA